jgi:glycosyltransferase involved in cell wall biosynthesis
MIVGGAQENTLYTCLDLQQQYGDEVTLITGPATGPEGDLLQRHPRGSEVNVVSSPLMRRAIHPWRDWQCLRWLRRELLKLRPDVVHTHSAKGGILGRFAAHRTGVPAIVHTVHGAPFHEYQNAIARGLSRRCECWAARRCHHLISVADAMTDRLATAGVAPREMFSTIYSGMEVEPFVEAQSLRAAVRSQFGFRDEHVVIGKVARLFELKGHEYVIQSAVDVCRRNPDARFLFVGDGVLRGRLEKQIADAGLTEHFVFAGLRPPTEIPELIAAMDLLVHASLREGLARALPQALIAGKPVVSFDIDGAREVALDGITGRLLPPQDVAALAEALMQLSSDEALRQRLGDEGRRRFTEQFRHQTMTAQIRRVYERVLAGERGFGGAAKRVSAGG